MAARVIAAIAVFGAITAGSPCPDVARAQIDATGAFDTGQSWGLNIRQSGTALSACLVLFTPSGPDLIPFGSGVIDSQTGEFSLAASDEFRQFVGPYGGGFLCAMTYDGTFAAAGSSFTAQYEERTQCVPPPFSCVPTCALFYTEAITGTRITTTPFSCCGDGIVEGDEQCDEGDGPASGCCNACAFGAAISSCASDGNACTADQCDGLGVCQHVALTGTPCNDGLFCNGADTCDAGTCAVHGGDPCAGGDECNDTCAEGFNACWGPDFTPCTDDGNAWTADFCEGSCQHRPTLCGPCEAPGLTGCAPAPAASFACAQPSGAGAARLVVNNRSDGGSDSLRWTLRAPPAPPSDFGSPTTVDDYAICVYDESAPGAPALLLQAHLVSGATCGTKPCWNEYGTPAGGKQRYKDKAAAVAGTKLLRLQADASRSRIAFKGKGVGLGLPPAGWQAPLRVQVRSETGRCWESALTDVRKDSATRLVVVNE